MLVKTIPSPDSVFKQIPLSSASRERILTYRNTIKNILNRKDSRLLLIAGPCSIHDLKSIRDYASFFHKLSKEVSEYFFPVLRTYFEKPRSVKGWKGFLNDPYLDGTYDIISGILLTRKLLVELAELGIPCCSELLEIHTSSYFSELLSWGCIGARTSTSQPHRQLAAYLDFPIGFKNTTDGNIDNAINGVIAASSPQHFLGVSSLGQLSQFYAKGNPNCHIVLRGGQRGPNYDALSINDTHKRCQQAGILGGLIVDCSHDNCGKKYSEQAEVFQSVIQQVVEGNSSIAGIMLESFLYEGNQPMSSQPRYGISLTDPCLSWQATEKLVQWGVETLASSTHALFSRN